MDNFGVVGFVLFLVTFVFSYKGLKSLSALGKWEFSIERIVLYKEYQRLITSGFVHANWTHLIFNLLALYCFAGIEAITGPLYFGLIYLCSLLGGNLLSLFLHRHDSGYAAVGASGAISGIIFFNIAVFPESNIGLFFLPLAIPGWIFGVLYIIYCIYGIRGRIGNIGHDAHLGGGMVGIMAAAILYPAAIANNIWVIMLMTVPFLVFMYLLLTKPAFMFVDKPFREAQGVLTVEDKYNSTKVDRERELNRLLDKISRNGYHSLSKKERKNLDDLST